ncbi:TIGR01777 family oxidoreductase [Dyadobacter fanqingshengii]|uniref:TIGR01777 family oxidoreductase n=1 Tax=Dyadobacter fanqingshengii TaxID=2906443 RepID=A0A9X1P6L4_9BACT|nr:TIGR01777 family oxidoreductase [Dyadobacter fanqingshengii]MCF0038639.1 TIGR01777 family oxidoreductase [Dyadobacter fanqingshengii]USJ34528.1 TIGR01777 family oxidoreductase [Dyadobacter fanqingshengii]
MKGKKVLITGGTGLIGKRLTQLLLEKGYEVAFLSRKKTSIPSVQVFEWNVEKGYIEEGALENTDYLIHLAGAGVADERWTEERKKLIISSRTETAKLILDKLVEKNIRPAAFVSSSGSSYYGEDTGDVRNSESSPPNNDFLSQVTVVWEKAADDIAALGIRTVKLRTGIVLSNEGGAIPKMAAPAKFGFGSPLGSGKQWISWIHIDDLCRMYIEAMENESWQGAYNAIASQPVTNEELTKQICIALNRPQWLPNVPSFALKMVFGEMASVVLGSSYLVNERIAKETNFQYRFSELDKALKDILS